jgi:hydroxyquinol 1,2-dioxygenase
MTTKEEGAPVEVFPELTRDVIDRMDNAKSARLQEVMKVVIRHLHAIVREVKITHGEWARAIDFLRRAPARCVPKVGRS